MSYYKIEKQKLEQNLNDVQKMIGTTSSQTIAKPTVMRSYSLDEVREIALEYRNTCMYGHSHKLTRFELQDELRKIDKKHDLDYKEGVDYTLG